MTLKEHTIQASIGSIILAPVFGFKVIIFFLSMILIDVDHYFDYMIVCKRFDIRGMFKYHRFLWSNKESVYGISIFHTIEIFLILFLLGFWSHYFWMVLLGFFVHLMFDLYYLYKYATITNRAVSIIEYLIRRKKLNCYPLPPDNFWDVK